MIPGIEGHNFGLNNTGVSPHSGGSRGLYWLGLIIEGGLQLTYYLPAVRIMYLLSVVRLYLCATFCHLIIFPTLFSQV